MSRARCLRHLLADPRGAAALEFGLTISFFMMLVLGIMEVGRYVAMQQSLTSAVLEGGRYAVVHGSKSSSPATSQTITTQIQNNCGILTGSSISANVTFSPNNSPGSTVTISATYPWVPLVPLLNLPSMTMKATSVTTILN